MAYTETKIIQSQHYVCKECNDDVDSCDECCEFFDEDDIVYCDVYNHLCKECWKKENEK
jgi:hypothetical protein